MKLIREFVVRFGYILAAWFAGALLAAIVYKPAHAAEGDLREIKLGTGATQYTILVPFPATGTKCIRFMDGADGTTLGKTLGCWKMGTGLTITGGDTLNAAGSPGPKGDQGDPGATGPAGPPGTTTWAGITDKPTFATVATTGAYADLTGLPTIPAAQVNADWNAVSGVAQILNKPALFNGAYSSLTGIPSTFAPAAHTHPASQISDSTATGRAVMTAVDAAAARTAIGAGTGSGTVTSVTAGAGLSGGTITAAGTISMPNTGTPGTYSGVTTDAQGRVVSGTTLSINDAPGRALVNSTSATGFQVSSTRPAYVCYEGIIQTTSTIGGPASGTVSIETANTNSTTPGDWTTIAQQTASNTITLAIVLNQVDGEPWSLCRMISAGKFIRIRTNFTGTVSFSINATQQEVLM